MKPPAFAYFDPETVDEAVNLLVERDNAKLLAGGQSLMPMLAMRYVLPNALIDLNRIASLAHVTDDGDVVRIGSMTRQRDLEISSVIRRRLPLMAEALSQVGHLQTRNRGTIGGSLCHLDPAAELPSVALAFDAVITVQGSNGTRDIPMSAFHAFFMTPAITAGELVTEIRFAPWRQGHGSAFSEFARRHGDFAVASVAVLLDLTEDRRIGRVSLTVSGLSHAPVRVTEAEQLLAGAAPSDRNFDQAAALCGTIEATGDVHASAAYRQRLAVGLTGRALRLACARARRHSAGVPT
jgi:aerobic carbon-monoxide dehydrogenase medium subunit